MTLPRVILHVGTPKSGTTYLQDLFWDSRPALAEAGVLCPGDSPAAHFLAALDLADGNFHGWQDPAVPGAWERLAEAARAHTGTTLISHELLGDLSEDAIARVLAALDFAEVHVVVTARDLGRQLPAVWQEDVKNRHFLPFQDFLSIVRPGSGLADVPRPAAGREEGHAAAFWLRQDVPALLRRWGATLPGDRLHLVTVPPSGADPATLWRRFAAVLGVDPTIARLPEGRRNRSLGRAESEVLRRLNEKLGYTVEWPLYESRITHLLGRVTLPERPHSAALTVPDSARQWVAARADTMIADLAALGARVVGDLEDLRIPAVDPAGPYGVPSSEELLDAALDALVALIPTGPDAPGQVETAESEHLEDTQETREVERLLAEQAPPQTVAPDPAPAPATRPAGPVPDALPVEPGVPAQARRGWIQARAAGRRAWSSLRQRGAAVRLTMENRSGKAETADV
jgi:hypothetical protein